MFRFVSHPLLILSIILVPVLTIIISVLLYIAGDPTFNLTTHYLSDLGAGPNGSSFVFNLGIIITSIIMIIFYIHLSLILHFRAAYRYLIILSFTLGILSALGTLFVGIFPINVSQDLHNFSASFFFLGGLGTAFFYTLTEFLTPSFSKVQAITGLLIIVAFLIFIVYNALTYFNPGSFEIESHLSEWSLFFSLIFWIVEHAIIVFRRNRQKINLNTQ